MLLSECVCSQVNLILEFFQSNKMSSLLCLTSVRYKCTTYKCMYCKTADWNKSINTMKFIIALLLNVILFLELKIGYVWVTLDFFAPYVSIQVHANAGNQKRKKGWWTLTCQFTFFSGVKKMAYKSFSYNKYLSVSLFHSLFSTSLDNSINNNKVNNTLFFYDGLSKFQIESLGLGQGWNRMKKLQK